jgi:hypothetical protein
MQELQKQKTLTNSFPLNLPREDLSRDRSASSINQDASFNKFVDTSGDNPIDSSNSGGTKIVNKRKGIILLSPLKEDLKYQQAPQARTFHYGIRFQLKRLCCYFGGKNSEQYKTYFALNNYLTERMDLRYYLHSLQKNDRTRTVLFNYYQNLSFDFMKSPNVCSAAELEEMDLMLYRNTDENFNELIQYFRERKANGTRDGYDKQLFEMVRQDVKDFVMDKSN